MDHENNEEPVGMQQAGRLAGGAAARLFPPVPSRGDVISRPNHYMGLGGLEARHVIRDWGLSFELGNVVKYILRHRSKAAPIEDLKKARQYVIFAMEAVEEFGDLREWVAPGLLEISPLKAAAAFDLGPTLSEALGAIHAAVTIPDIALRQLECAGRCLSQAIVALQAQGAVR